VSIRDVLQRENMIQRKNQFFDKELEERRKKKKSKKKRMMARRSRRQLQCGGKGTD
jgi:hypothetical protein